MRIPALVTLVAVLGATVAASPPVSSVTVQPSSLGYKQAMAACPGALAAISIVLNHVRVAELPGVASDIDDANPTAQLITLTDAAGASAAVTVNAKAHTVSGKNVKLSGKSVACVRAD